LLDEVLLKLLGFLCVVLVLLVSLLPQLPDALHEFLRVDFLGHVVDGRSTVVDECQSSTQPVELETDGCFQRVRAARQRHVKNEATRESGTPRRIGS